MQHLLQDANMQLVPDLSNNWEQAVRTHPDISFDGQTCCSSVTTCVVYSNRVAVDTRTKKHPTDNIENGIDEYKYIPNTLQHSPTTVLGYKRLD